MLLLFLFGILTAESPFAQRRRTPPRRPQPSQPIFIDPNVLNPSLLPTILTSDGKLGSASVNYAELTAVAIPKKGICSSSNVNSNLTRIFGSAARDVGQKSSFGDGAYEEMLLKDNFIDKVLTIPGIKTRIDKALTGKNLFPVSDNQMLRLPSGELLAARNTYIDSNAAPWWNGTTGGRVGMVLVKSSDCGKTWEFVSVLDPKDITLSFNGKNFAGAGAYPQKDWLNQAAGTTQFYQGGWDRQEVYADPWGGQTIYVTLWAGANDDRTKAGWPAADSNLPSVVNAMVLSSTDGGKSWGSKPIVMFDRNPVPIVMTAPSAGRLFLFNCVNGAPTLHYIKNGKYIGQQAIFFGDGSKQENKCAGSVPNAQVTSSGSLSRILNDVSISRVNSSTVRLVYPAVQNGRRVARIVIAQLLEVVVPKIVAGFPPTFTQETKMIGVVKLHEQTIAAKSNTDHVIYPTFIETDRVDLPKSSKINTAVLYWYETGPDPAIPSASGNIRLFTRYAVFREDGKVAGGTASIPQNLSVTDGVRRYWTPANGEFIGDYMRGAFFFDGKLRYFALWPERRPGENLRISYNVITIEP